MSHFKFYSAPPYVVGHEIIKGMIIENIISLIDEQLYTLGSQKEIKKSELKIFYSDECTQYL
ncbi:hypothetical protein AS579_17200 [Acinetobacter baumannii]|nr:hypothetical protein ACINNAV83_2981 [Acinetobacter baumannii Naval-83]PCN75555.1 hypothetical protein AS579_17200 [Acinetobacter baumannii]PCN87688.1 hypothetical protein AS582_17315 [Acinetobacter baumannii]PCN91067.1 hypothetical protein AS583_15740 [Acinetobacter baumannii]